VLNPFEEGFASLERTAIESFRVRANAAAVIKGSREVPLTSIRADYRRVGLLDRANLQPTNGTIFLNGAD
jgi:hypothetical protein